MTLDARHRRLAFVYTPTFTLGAALILTAGTTLNGLWLAGAALLTLGAAGVVLDLENPMTEQPIEPAPAKLKVQHRDGPVDEQVWLGNKPAGPQLAVKDPGYAAAFDDASDQLDAAGDALESGDLRAAEHHALNLVGAIRSMRTIDQKRGI